MTDVLIDREDRIASITVNRPEKRNSMDIDTRDALREAFDGVAGDPDVRVAILRGAGEGQFITGGDIESFTAYDQLAALDYIDTHAQGLYNYVAELSMPTIAAIDGYAFGGGLEIACACDIRVARRGVKLGLPEVTLGILPAGGGTQRLVKLVGASVATDLILTGKPITAEEAAEVGLVNYLYDDNEFEEGVREVAVSIADNAPIALQLANQAITRAMDMEAGLDFERLAGAFLFGTADKQEGMAAFLEDRDPHFEGR